MKRLAGNALRPSDWVVAVLAVVAHLTRVRAGAAPVTNDALEAALSPVLAVAAGLPLVLRRARPGAVAVIVLGATAGLVAVQGLVPAWGAWVLVWSLALHGPDPRRSMVAAARAAAVTLAILGLGAIREPTGAGLLLAAVTVIVALVAVLVRSERSRVAEAAQRATVEERMRIARDLHDLVGHGLGAVAVQSSTARLALAAGDTDVAGRALAGVESSSRTALREMRQMLEILAEEGPAATDRGVALAGAPTPGVAELPGLVGNVRAGGMAVDLVVDPGWEAASAGAQLAAYRVVQEALTNALKHAPGSPVTVRLTTVGGTGRVVVESAGEASPAGPPDGGGGGHGLGGLAARVTALGGEFWAGSVPQGWLVDARFPLREEGSA